MGTFEGTSLHLSLTGYEAPLGSELSGVRSHEAYIVETRVSLNDRGNWVVDLDVLNAFASAENGIRALNFSGHCGHDPSFTNLKYEATSIDTWEEFLDPPQTVMVVRASNSWMARLGAVSLAAQRGYNCRYLPPHGEICWECVVRSLGQCRPEKTVLIL